MGAASWRLSLHWPVVWVVLMCAGVEAKGTPECPYHILMGAAPAPGHLTPVLGIAQALLERGCEVTFPIAAAAAHTVRDYATVKTRDGVERSMRVLEVDSPVVTTPHSVRETMSNGGKWEQAAMMFSGVVTNAFLDLTGPYHDALLHLWEEEGTPDLVLAMPSALGVLTAAEVAEVPIVQTMPGVVVTQLSTFHHVPHFGSQMGQSDLDAFLARVGNSLMPYVQALLFKFSLGAVQEFRASKGLPPACGFFDTYDSVMLQQTSFGLEYAQPLPPSHIMVGPIFPEKEVTLDDDLWEWLNRHEDILYVALGSQVMMSEELAANMTETFRHTGPVLWAVRGEQAAILPELVHNLPHVRIEGFLAQRAVLAHPHVKAFWTHAGASSTHEGLFNGLPLLCMPFFGDQPDLARRVEDAGAGLRISKANVDPIDAAEKIGRLMTEESFAENAARVKATFEFAGGRDKAVDIVLETIRFGDKHLLLASRSMHWFRADCWDLFLLQVVTFFVLPYLFYRLLHLLFRKCCGAGSRKAHQD